MKAVVEIELIRLIIHNNDGKIAEAIESAGSRTGPKADRNKCTAGGNELRNSPNNVQAHKVVP